MGHVAMVTWDGGGNVPPALRIAEELRGRGHEVTILGHEPQRAVIERTGATFVPYRHALPWSRAAAQSDPAAHFKIFLDEGAGQDLAELLASRPAGAVVCDCLMLGALQAAQAVGVPNVVLSHSFWAFFGQGLPHSPITEMGAPVGRAPLELWEAASEVLVLADEELDPSSGPVPGNVRWTGVVQEQATPAPREDPSRILLSLSTVWFPGQQEAMQRILEALGGLPVRVTATIERNLDRTSLRVPGNVEVLPFVPHGELMPQVSLVVGHGGHATTMFALAHDLPLLIVPQYPIDQPMVGQAVADAGAAICLSQEASVEELRGAITSLLGDERYAQGAAEIGARLRSQRGGAVAAERIEVWVDAGVLAG